LRGTAALVFIGFSTGALIFGTSLVSQWLPGVGPRLLLAGVCFGGGGTLVTLSPLGQRSGAHLNPSVSLAFFLLNRMHRHDLLGYLAAQFVGASCGAVLAVLVDRTALRAIHFDLTVPGAGVTIWQALLTEFLATSLLIGVILLFVSFRRTARLTPFAVWLLIATLVWQTAPISGTSLNPARSFGSELLAWLWRDQWIYFVAPSLAGVAVALGYRWVVGPHHIVTAKLFHPLTDVVSCHFPHCALCPAISVDAGSSRWLRPSQWLRPICLSRQRQGREIANA
jgi:aquaporin Z